MKNKLMTTACAMLSFGLVAGLLPAADWTFVPASYTDTAGKT